METGSDNRFSSDWRADATKNIGESHPKTMSNNQATHSPSSSLSSSSSQNPFLNHCDSDNNTGNRGMMNNDHNSSTYGSLFTPSSPGNPFVDPPKRQSQGSFGAFESWDSQPSVCKNAPTNVEPHNNNNNPMLDKDQGHQNSLGTFSESSSETSSDSSDDEIDLEINSMLTSISKHDAQSGNNVVAGKHSASSSISSATGSNGEFGTKENSSEVQNPPVQVMERPAGGDTGYVFPAHVFDRKNANPTGEWSTASNESLFSIYMGNMSFTNELMCFNNKSSTEMDKPGGDMFMLDTPPNAPPTQHQKQQPQPNAAPSHQQPQPQPLPPPPVSKFTDISQRTAELHEENLKVNEAKAFETMREVIMETSRTTENAAAAKVGEAKSRHQSDGSTQSFAFQSSSYKDKNAASKGVEDKQKQQNQTGNNKQQQEAPKAAVEAPNNAPPKKFLSCFSCCPFG